MEQEEKYKKEIGTKEPKKLATGKCNVADFKGAANNWGEKMTYIKKNIMGNVEAELIDIEDWKRLIKDIDENLVPKKDLEKIKETIEDLEERFDDLENKKSKGIDKELENFFNQVKTFKKEIESIRKRIIQNTKEMEEKSKTLKQEQTNLHKQLIKKLNSEYLKKLDKQIKPEDIDTLKVLEEYYNKSMQGLKEEQAQEFVKEIEDTIPRLSINEKIKFRLLQARDKAEGKEGEEDNYYFVSLKKILRELIDKMRAGMEIKDISISTEEITKGQKKEEEYYGD